LGSVAALLAFERHRPARPAAQGLGWNARGGFGSARTAARRGCNEILPREDAMTAPFQLFALSLKRSRKLLLASALLLGAFQVQTVLIAGSIQRSGDFEQLASLLPPVVRELLGASIASVMSFRGIVCLGYFDLAIVIGLLSLIIALATVP